MLIQVAREMAGGTKGGGREKRREDRGILRGMADRAWVGKDTQFD